MAVARRPPATGSRAEADRSGRGCIPIWRSRFCGKYYDGERRSGDHERVFMAAARHRLGDRSTAVADPAAAVDLGIGVEQLAPEAPARHAEPVAPARDRREVRD